jgi:hypothetical protein
MAQLTTSESSDRAATSVEFASKLPHGRQRFLAHAVEHSFAVGRRTAADFLRCFPPEVIMEGLADKADLRAEILCHTTGIKRKIAEKKSWQSAAEDLRIALQEGETNAEAVISVFDPDDRVRYLDEKLVWKFLVEGSFWTVAPSKKEEYRAAKRHVAYMLDRALGDKLLGHRDIVDGVSVAELASRLPKAELGKIIEGALKAGHQGAPFTEAELLGAMPPDVLVEYVPLGHIFEAVIEPKIAIAHGYLVKDGVAAAQRSPEAAKRAAKLSEHPDWVEVPEEANAETVSEDLISEDDFATG